MPTQPDDGWQYPPTQPNPPVPPAPPQYSLNTQTLGITGYQVAHQDYDAKGAGVTVAVIDTGFDRAKWGEEFGSRLLDGYNAVTAEGYVGEDREGDQDYGGHGTMMARIIGGSGQWSDGRVTMVGVAPQANIYPVLASANGYSIDKTHEAIAHVATQDGVRVVNMSFGAQQGTCDASCQNNIKASFVALKNAGKLSAVGAGNFAQAYPDEINAVAVPATDSETASHILVAGAITAGSKTMENYSVQAHGTKDRYLVAPVLLNLGTEGAPHWINGTSAAAAIVSGAAAVVWGRWPYLKADRVADILLQTAEDLGDPGVDEVYGHGLLRLDQAMQPQGDLIAQSITGRSIKLGQTVGTLPATTVQAIVQRVPYVQYKDRFDRNFEVSTAALFGARAHDDAGLRAQALARQAEPVRELEQGGASFAFAGAADRTQPLVRLGFANNVWQGAAWRGAGFAPRALQDNPAVGRLSDDSGGASVGFKLAGGLSVGMDALAGKTWAQESIRMGQVRLGWSGGNWSAQASWAQGDAGAQADGKDRRRALGLEVGYAWSDAARLSLAWRQGVAEQTLAYGMGAAQQRDDALVLRLDGEAGLKVGDRYHVALSVPTRQRIAFDAQLPVRVDADTGALQYERVSFSQRVRSALRLDVGYAAPLSGNASLNVGATLSSQAGGSGVHVRWSRSF